MTVNISNIITWDCSKFIKPFDINTILLISRGGLQP